VLRNATTSEERIVHLSPEQEKNESFFHDPDTGVELEVIEKEPMVEWFANNYKNFGCNLEFVTDKSGEGTQFVKGFGGIGGILRWKVDFVEMADFEDQANHHGGDDSESEDGDDDDEYGFDDGDYGF
jgi:peptide chain release factor subunit 1